jgi:hypothetical protein
VLAEVLIAAARGRWRRARTAAAPTRRRRGRGGRYAAAASETVFFLKSSGGNREGRRRGRGCKLPMCSAISLRCSAAVRSLSASVCSSSWRVASQCVIAARRNRGVFRPGCAACPSWRSSAPPAAAAGPCCQTPAHSSVNRGKLNPIGYI